MSKLYSYAIDWINIENSISWYIDRGYKYIDTPWIVEQSVSEITFPQDDAVSLTNGKVLVGSAEQGFLQLIVDKNLQQGEYVSAGPCYRLQDEGKSIFHRPYFFKVELFCLCQNHFDANMKLQRVRNSVKEFLNNYTATSFTEIETSDGYDFELNGIEIGSYGVRYHPTIGWWAYGTGLAEPRFTQALHN